MPQVPQFVRSFSVSAQNAPPLPLHVVSGDAQVAPHVPPLQTWPAAQVVPHAPQFWPSVESDTQRPPHARCPGGQTTEHAPATQNCPVAHECPHVPQFNGSVCRSTHAEPHTVRGAAHEAASASDESPVIPSRASDASPPPSVGRFEGHPASAAETASKAMNLLSCHIVFSFSLFTDGVVRRSKVGVVTPPCEPRRESYETFPFFRSKREREGAAQVGGRSGR